MDYSSFKLETERLILTSTDERFTQNIYDNFNARVTRYMMPKPAENIGETQSFVESAKRHNREGTDIYVTFLKKDDNSFIGQGGLHNVGSDVPELGVWIAEYAFGHHYGREAMTALALYAVKTLGKKGLVYPVDKDNVPSRKIPESLGGVVVREYQQENNSGVMLNTVEYYVDGKKLTKF